MSLSIGEAYRRHESLRGAIRIAEQITIRRHRTAALDGHPWGKAVLDPVVLDDAERDLERAISAVVLIDDAPPDQVRAAARATLLRSGWVHNDSVECLVSRIRSVMRAGWVRGLSLVPAPKPEAANDA